MLTVLTLNKVKLLMRIELLKPLMPQKHLEVDQEAILNDSL